MIPKSTQWLWDSGTSITYYYKIMSPFPAGNIIITCNALKLTQVQ